VRIARTVGALRDARADAENVALVPTMGAFHAGHLALFEAATRECDFVVVSLFVNPAQFGPQDDLARYPRDEARDVELAEAAGIDILFVPSDEELYPHDFGTWVEVGDAGAEGSARPGHFRGVATICLKLFHIVGPEIAYFGQKDAQQVAALRRMVRDLNLDLKLRVVPTVRDEHGLALSSRNAYLSAEERRNALALPRALAAGRDAYRNGGDPVEVAHAALNGLVPDYVEIVDLGSATVLAAAARVGSTRLIDNVLLEGDLQ
jgi:pantoate--beta-alanine ligase